MTTTATAEDAATSTVDARHHGRRPSTQALADAMAADERRRSSSARTSAPLGGVFRDHRRAGGQVRRGPLLRHPARRVRHRRHRRRHGDERPAARSWRCSSTRSPIRRSSRSLSHWPRCATAPAARVALPDRHPDSLRRRHRRRGAPLRLLRGLLRAHPRPAGRHAGDASGTPTRCCAQAIACPDPVIFLEPKRCTGRSRPTVLDPDRTDAGDRSDRAVVRRPGRDVDPDRVRRRPCRPRWRRPRPPRRRAAASRSSTCAACPRSTTRRCAPRCGGPAARSSSHEARRFCGYGAEIAARLTERCFHYLEAPVLRVAGFDIPYPPPKLEQYHLPGVDRILDAVDDLQWEDREP